MKTLLDNWERFEDVDISAAAPAGQRQEMMRAFYAGAASAVAILVKASNRQELHAIVEKLLVEEKAFLNLSRSITLRGAGNG